MRYYRSPPTLSVPLLSGRIVIAQIITFSRIISRISCLVGGFSARGDGNARFHHLTSGDPFGCLYSSASTASQSGAMNGCSALSTTTTLIKNRARKRSRCATRALKVVSELYSSRAVIFPAGWYPTTPNALRTRIQINVPLRLCFNIKKKNIGLPSLFLSIVYIMLSSCYPE